jgi:hypothetical protein
MLEKGRFIIALLAALLPGPAFAQLAGSSGIAGVVRDTSGAVLPGVTVEASSPALIEQTRTVVTQPVRQRQDGVEGERRQIHGPGASDAGHRE